MSDSATGLRDRIMKRLVAIRTAYRSGGILPAADSIRDMLAYHVHTKILDPLFNTETAKTREITELSDLNLDEEYVAHGTDYTATPVLVARWILRSLPIEPQGWTFIDIGAGRGRVVLEAARFNFKKVIGIDLSPELLTDAKRNIDLALSKEVSKRIILRIEDATIMKIPAGNCIFYLYNPFDADILFRFISNIIENKSQQRFILIYHNPVHIDIIQRENRIFQLNIGLINRLRLRFLANNKTVFFEINKDALI